MARQVLPVVGAAIGAYFGGSTGAQFGWAIGSLVGNAVDPLVIQRQGPRLDDLKVTTSAYGNPIPLIKGHPRVGGTIVWNSDRREIVTTSEEQQGKGGPVTETTTYTYEIDLLVELSANELAGLVRIWANSALAWSQAADADVTSVLASADFARRVTFYDGNDDQLPDPTYEAAVGVGNAPAYRGRSTVFIEGLQLGGGGNLPNLTFEVAELATIAGASGTFVNDVPCGSAYVGVPNFRSDGFMCFSGPSALPTHIDTFWCAPDPQPAGTITVEFSGYTRATVGISDVDCILIGSEIEGINGPNLRFLVYTERARYQIDGEDAGAGVTVVTLPISMDGGVIRFCRHNDLYLFGSPAGQKKLVTSTWVMSADLPDNVSSVVHDGVTAYAVTLGNEVYQLDMATLAVQDHWPAPAGFSSGLALAIDEDGSLYIAGIFGADGRAYRRVGSDWVLHIDGMGSATPDVSVSPLTHAWGIHHGLWFTLKNAVGATPFDVNIARQAITALDIPLADVVTDVCERAGLPGADIDVTGLSGNVRSLAVASVTSARQVLDLLGRAHSFQSVETGGKVKFVSRGGAPSGTLAYDELGVTEDASQSQGDPLALSRANDSEAPATVTVRYANVENDYQEGAETSFRLTAGNGDQVLEIALGLSPSEAKRIADRIVTDYGVSLTSVNALKLDRTASKYEPTDVLLLTDGDGSVYRARVEKIDDASGVRTMQLVLDDASVIDSTAATSGGYASSSVVALPSTAKLELMDIPILRDADNEPGFYVAMTGNGPTWPGGAYFRSADGVMYERIGTVTERAIMGTATTTLGDWAGGNVVDESNTLTVDVGASELSTITRDQLLNSELNVLLVGSEIIQFQRAALVSAGVYTVSGLLRGRRATEWAMTDHAADERVVMLRPTGMRRVAMQLSERGLNRFYKGVSFGRSISSAMAIPFANTAVGLKPFSPTDLRAARAAGGDITLTWKRRSRLSSRFLAPGVEIPLGEESESYDVEIWDSTYTTLKRTFSGLTAPSATYTSAQQVADFGGNQPMVYARVYQRSASVGRGYALQQAA
jgi:hypothetical protein